MPVITICYLWKLGNTNTFNYLNAVVLVCILVPTVVGLRDMQMHSLGKRCFPN